MFVVIDTLKANARGDGLGLVRCNQQTSFLVTAPAAQLHDLEITITGLVERCIWVKVQLEY